MQHDQAIEKLLLLTLTLEEALRREDFEEADGLFRQRDLAIDAVEALKVPRTHPTVKILLDADRRLGLFLATRSRQTVDEIRKIQAHGRARHAYSQAS